MHPTKSVLMKTFYLFLNDKSYLWPPSLYSHTWIRRQARINIVPQGSQGWFKRGVIKIAYNPLVYSALGSYFNEVYR